MTSSLKRHDSGIPVAPSFRFPAFRGEYVVSFLPSGIIEIRIEDEEGEITLKEVSKSALEVEEWIALDRLEDGFPLDDAEILELHREVAS